MRDKHNLISGSTSPPPKRNKIKRKDSIGDESDTEVGEVEMDNLDKSMEDMDIDEPMDTADKIAERSNFWDNKVEQKKRD